MVSISAFALIGYFGARRVFQFQELMFQRMLRAGASVPEQAPCWSLADRWPAILVAMTMLLLIGLIILAIVFLG